MFCLGGSGATLVLRRHSFARRRVR